MERKKPHELAWRKQLATMQQAEDKAAREKKEHERKEQREYEALVRAAEKKGFIPRPRAEETITISLVSKLDVVTAADGILEAYKDNFPARVEDCYDPYRPDLSALFPGIFDRSKTFIWVYFPRFYKAVGNRRVEDENRHLILKGRGMKLQPGLWHLRL